MRVLFILPHPIEGPSSRFRVYQYIPYLEANGIKCTVRPFVSSKYIATLYKSGGIGYKIALTLAGLLHRFGDILRANRYDVAFILREAFALGPPFVEAGLANAAKCMVYDFDDAIYTRSLVYKNPIDRLRDWDKPSKVLKLADTVIAGSSYLADYADQHTNGQVEILPTVVDHTVYCPRAISDEQGKITLGWIGTPRGSSYVADMMPVFKNLASRHPSLRMVFVGCAPFEKESLDIEFRQWTLENEPSDIASFDIGIMPLTDDEETRGKCGFKLIQYMSSGVAAVGSPVGANNDIIESEVSGLFASSLLEWEEQIERLITDKPLRKRLQASGRKRAIDHYSLAHTAPKMLRFLKETLERKNAQK
jgi:glycosyltransferase involved in cell wall biosynthesis